MNSNICPKCDKRLRSNNTTGFCVKHSQNIQAKKRRDSGKAKEYYENNKEKVLEQARKDNKNSYQKHKEKRKAAVKKYREDNWELIKERGRISYRKDPSKVKAAASRNIWHRFKRTCKDRGILNALTREEYEILVNKPCMYCGDLRGKYSQSIWIDRIDSSLHYTKNNVNPCCPSCNMVKHTLLTADEMTEVAQLLKKLRGRKLIWQI